MADAPVPPSCGEARRALSSVKYVHCQRLITLLSRQLAERPSALIKNPVHDVSDLAFCCRLSEVCGPGDFPRVYGCCHEIWHHYGSTRCLYEVKWRLRPTRPCAQGGPEFRMDSRWKRFGRFMVILSDEVSSLSNKQGVLPSSSSGSGLLGLLASTPLLSLPAGTKPAIFGRSLTRMGARHLRCGSATAFGAVGYMKKVVFLQVLIPSDVLPDAEKDRCNSISGRDSFMSHRGHHLPICPERTFYSCALCPINAVPLRRVRT